MNANSHDALDDVERAKEAKNSTLVSFVEPLFETAIALNNKRRLIFENCARKVFACRSIASNKADRNGTGKLSNRDRGKKADIYRRAATGRFHSSRCWLPESPEIAINPGTGGARAVNHRVA